MAWSFLRKKYGPMTVRFFLRAIRLSQNALYKILDEDKEAKPRFETIIQLLQAVGLRFTVEPIGKTRAG